MAALVPWLGVWILVSAADDLVVLISWLIARVRRALPAPPPASDLDGVEQQRVAIFVPCWKESEVIAGMLRHNLAAIRLLARYIWRWHRTTDRQAREIA